MWICTSHALPEFQELRCILYKGFGTVWKSSFENSFSANVTHDPFLIAFMLFSPHCLLLVVSLTSWHAICQTTIWPAGDSCIALSSLSFLSGTQPINLGLLLLSSAFTTTNIADTYF